VTLPAEHLADYLERRADAVLAALDEIIAELRGRPGLDLDRFAEQVQTRAMLLFDLTAVKPTRHLVEVTDRFAVARWSRNADVGTICRCILGTLKYEPHSADVTPLRRALEDLIARSAR
jgi:hypothetical protein